MEHRRSSPRESPWTTAQCSSSAAKRKRKRSRAPAWLEAPHGRPCTRRQAAGGGTAAGASGAALTAAAWPAAQ
eukprot:13302131-Alexandrium_andersonii.AAC.1